MENIVGLELSVWQSGGGMYMRIIRTDSRSKWYPVKTNQFQSAINRIGFNYAKPDHVSYREDYTVLRFSRTNFKGEHVCCGRCR